MLMSCYMQILTCIDYGVEVIQSLGFPILAGRQERALDVVRSQERRELPATYVTDYRNIADS
jgi:hypothetical protein